MRTLRLFSVVSPVQQVVRAVLLAGIALVFVLVGREPGWQAYVISGSVAVLFLLASLAMWRGSHWLGMLALGVLLVVMFWQPERPFNAIVGAVLAILNSAMAFSERRPPESSPTAPVEGSTGGSRPS